VSGPSDEGLSRVLCRLINAKPLTKIHAYFSSNWEAFLCSAPSITPVPRPDYAGYIARWLDVIKADKHAIFNAARAGKVGSFQKTAMESVP
jgi:antirestriction protein ArdC